MESPYRGGAGSSILKGCGLLLASICCVATLPLLLLYSEFVVPLIQNVKVENLSPASKRANDYVLEGKGWPIPQDVHIGPTLEAYVASRGFEEYLGEYFQITGTIAAAENWGIRRADLLTIMDIEGGWLAEIPAYTYVRATEVATYLIYLGYDPVNILARDAAILSYGGGEYLDLFLQTRKTWSQVAADATITERDDKTYQRWPALVEYYLLLENIGYAEVIDIGGVAVIITDPDQIPPNELPEIPDGTLIWPCDCGISGFTFGDLGGKHTGVDLGGGGFVSAAHNGVVSYSSFLPASSSLAGELWISGNVVVIVGGLPDGNQMCTGYGHGANLLVEEGDGPRAGDIVFEMGTTGLSDGVHLHFFIRIGGSGPFCRGGVFVDPMALLP